MTKPTVQQLANLREEHYPGFGGKCVACGEQSPCPTIFLINHYQGTKDLTSHLDTGTL